MLIKQLRAIELKSLLPAGLIFTAASVCMVVAGGTDNSGSLPWLILCISMLFSIVYHAITSIFRAHWLRSTIVGYFMFVLMMVLLYQVASETATIGMKDLPQFQKFLVLLIIFKVLLTALAGLYRFFITLLNDQSR